MEELVNYSTNNKLPIIKSKTMKNEEKLKSQFNKRKEANSTERIIGESMKQTFVCNSKVSNGVLRY